MRLIGFELKKLFQSKFLYIMLAAALLVNVWLVCSEIKKTDVSNSEQLVSFIELYNKNPGEMDAYIEKFVKDYEKAAKTSKPYPRHIRHVSRKHLHR